MRETAAIILSLLLISLPKAGRPETVYLKDGQVLRGSILREDRESVSLKTRYQTRKIYREHILRIMYGNREMENVYLYLKDGSLVNGFLVDQDAEKIVFRAKRDSPEEKSILKSAIRQISNEEIRPLYPDISLSAGIFLPINSGGASLSPAPIYILGSGISFPPIRKSRILLELGYAKSMSSENRDRSFQLVPLTLKGLYPVETSWLKLTPRLGIGAVMLTFRDGEGEEYTGYDITASLGAGLDYRFPETDIRASLAAEYSIILEGSDILSSLILRAGINYRF